MIGLIQGRRRYLQDSTYRVINSASLVIRSSLKICENVWQLRVFWDVYPVLTGNYLSVDTGYDPRTLESSTVPARSSNLEYGSLFYKTVTDNLPLCASVHFYKTVTDNLPLCASVHFWGQWNGGDGRRRTRPTPGCSAGQKIKNYLHGDDSILQNQKLCSPV